MEEVKKSFISLINNPLYVPLTKKEFVIQLKIDNVEEFYKMLDELEKDMYFIETKKGRIISPNQAGLFVGKFISHRKGFGFIESDSEYERDLYIPSKDVNGAIHGDRVVAEVIGRNGDVSDLIYNISSSVYQFSVAVTLSSADTTNAEDTTHERIITRDNTKVKILFILVLLNEPELVSPFLDLHILLEFF